MLSLLWGALGNMFLLGSLVYVISALTGWVLAAIGGLSWTQHAVDLQITASSPGRCLSTAWSTS